MSARVERGSRPFKNRLAIFNLTNLRALPSSALKGYKLKFEHLQLLVCTFWRFDVLVFSSKDMTETVLPLCCFKTTETREDADAGITKENINSEVCYTTALFYISSNINLINNNGIIGRKYFIGNIQ